MNSKELFLLTADQLCIDAFGEMLKDYSAAGTPFLGMLDQSEYYGFEKVCYFHSIGQFLPKGSTPYTRYFLCDMDGRIYAQGDVRHAPTEELTYYAGYLGYGVLPSVRQQGYGSAICNKLLERAGKYYSDVIITCNSENDASRCIIEKNGGVLMDIRYWQKRNCYMRRYSVKMPQ